MPLNNLLACLKQQGCLTWDEQQLELDTIIVTHPDKDHVGGVTKLLEKYSYSGELLFTDAFYHKSAAPNKCVFLTDWERANEKYRADLYLCVSTCTYVKHSTPDASFGFYFPTSDARLLTKDVLKRTVFSHIFHRQNPTRPRQKDFNDTSILTTVNESSQGIDVVLTGDSDGLIIDRALFMNYRLRPHIKVFQVPHHGSEKNSDYELYISFTADVYLISGGGHDKYNHPNNEVLSAIIRACVDNQHRSTIVVTNSRGLKRDKVIPKLYLEDRLRPNQEWSNFVTICHLDDLFNPDNTSPYVTITSDKLLQDSDVVCWSPEGYITKIKECKEKLQNMEVQIFKKDTQARVISCLGKIITDTKVNKLKIVMVPVPEEPWTVVKSKRCINQMYVLNDSITDDYKSACFLELDEETRGSEPEVYWIYRYYDNYFDCKEYLYLELSKGRYELQEFTIKPKRCFKMSDKLYTI